MIEEERELLANDVLLAVEGDDFRTDDENDNGKCSSGEELDYEDFDEGIEQSSQMADDSMETIEVDSVVNFRQKKQKSIESDGKQASTSTDKQMNFSTPEELQRYVQGLGGGTWKEKEKELLKKHGIAGKKGENLPGSSPSFGQG